MHGSKATVSFKRNFYYLTKRTRLTTPTAEKVCAESLEDFIDSLPCATPCTRRRTVRCSPTELAGKG
jgi:hypothetical protein